MKLSRKQQIASYHAQLGSTLLWGMSVLLVLSVIGVTAARIGLIDTRIVGNEMYSMITYQTAESQLNTVRPPIDALAPDDSLAFIKLAMDESDNKLTVTESTDNGVLFGADNVSSSVTVRYGQRLSMCMPQEGYAMSVEMLQDAGGYDCHEFIVDAHSRLMGTGAYSMHELGLMHYAPAQGSNL